MITNTITHKYETSSFDQTTKFGINESDFTHIAAILEDKTYSNKLIFVQELSTNAHDAHVLVGKPDLPIDITLPTEYAPYFKIRDYGPGLSKEDIETVYTKYGASTKRHSNLFNGHLGIGSKSPFAYTKTFTIISYYEGQKTTYIAYKNELRESCISVAHSEPSDAPNGLEIVIPINVSDVYKVVEFACSVYTYFTPRPNVLNPTEKYLAIRKHTDAINILQEGTLDVDDDPVHYKILSDSHSCIVMGNVTYTINSTYWKKTKWKDLIDYSSIVYFVPIGSLTNAADRESLEYTDNTIKYITTIMEELVSCIAKEYNAKLAQINTLWEARVLLYSTQNHENKFLYEVISDKLIWKDQKLEVFFSDEEVKDIPIYVLRKATTGRRRRGYSEDYIEYTKYAVNSLYNTAATTTPIIIDRKINKKCDEIVKLANAYKLYSAKLSSDGYSYYEAAPLIISLPKGTSQDQIDVIKAHPSLIGAEFVYLDTFEGEGEGETSSNNSKSKAKAKANVFTLVNTFDQAIENWEIATPVDNPVPYVVIDRYKLTTLPCSANELFRIQETLNEEFPGLLPNGVIYGIKSRAASAVDVDRLDQFEHWIDNALLEYFKNNDLFDKYKETSFINWGKYTNTDWSYFFDKETVNNYTYNEGLFKKVVTEYSKLNKIKANKIPRSILNYTNQLQKSLTTLELKITLDMEVYIDKIYEAYPLFNNILNKSHLSRYSYKLDSIDIDALLEYITLKDQNAT